jgi:hypothetical protein
MPSLDVERMSRTRSSPCKARSIGLATVSSISAASAPGRVTTTSVAGIGK